MMRSEVFEEARPEGNYSQPNSSYNKPNNEQGGTSKPSDKQFNAMYYKVTDAGCSIDSFNDVIKLKASMAQYKWLMDNFTKDKFDDLVIKLGCR